MSNPQPPPLASKLRQIVENVKWLRPLPMSTNNVIKALDDPRTTAGVIAELIGLDQALTAQALQAANSAFFGFSTNCSSLNDAVMRLGFKRVRTLVLCSVASGPLNRRLMGYRLGAGELWQHGIAAATYAEKIARSVRYPEPEEAYVAGLMHDIGKLLLDQYVMEDYQKIVVTMQERKMRLWQVEEALFGVDHAEVGGMMATKWNFPSSLVSAIRHHHTPSLAWDNKKLAAIINVANAFTPADKNSLTGLDGRLITPDALDILQLNDESLNRMWSKITTETQVTGQFPWLSPAE